MTVGVEWMIDASGCDPERLRDLASVRAILERVIEQLTLRVVGEGVWHRFPAPGGVTGLYLLTESHLACHTYPEHGTATFNLYCCRPRRAWPWAEELARALGAEHVVVHDHPRGTSPTPRSKERPA
ncbi:MAG: hypothetical protein NVS3B10_15940 [Polyangiales bacterium]